MERNSKLLSVIVPVYKAEKYLHRCVDSILAQTWSNLEIILVDDGSPDNSGAMCDEYAGKDSRIRVIHKPNGGVSSARNAGIDAATGEYIAFVDSDDYIAPDMYEKLFGGITECDSVVVCDCFQHTSSGDTVKKLYEVSPDKNKTIGNFLMSDIGGSCWNMIIPVSVLDGLRFPEYLTMSEDYWLVLRVIVSANKVSKIDIPLYYYCVDNPSSLTHVLSRISVADGFRGIEEDKAFLEEAGIYQYVKKEWAWQILRFKSAFVMDCACFEYYRSFEPDANRYVGNCPLLSKRIKILMILLNMHCDKMVQLLILMYRLKNTLSR